SSSSQSTSTYLYSLSLHDALPILFLFAPIIVILIYSFNNGRLLVAFQEFGFDGYLALFQKPVLSDAVMVSLRVSFFAAILATLLDRKSTRLNSSHVKISYAVFCLK